MRDVLVEERHCDEFYVARPDVHQRFSGGGLLFSAAASLQPKESAYLNRKSSFKLYSHGISGDIPSALRRSGSPSKCSRSKPAFGAL